MEDPVVIEKDKVLVDCYRFKVEVTEEGTIRIYAFNSREKGGDTEITIQSGKILLSKETGGGQKEILKERMSEVVFKRVLETEG